MSIVKVKGRDTLYPWTGLLMKSVLVACCLHRDKFEYRVRVRAGPGVTISCLSAGAVGRVHVLHAWSTP